MNKSPRTSPSFCIRHPQKMLAESLGTPSMTVVIDQCNFTYEKCMTSIEA